MQVNVGKLNRRISIISKTCQKNSNGFPDDGNSVLYQTWSQVSNISGTELIKNNSNFESTSTRFLIRTPKKIVINKDMFILYKNNEYNIEYIHNYEDNSFYTEIFANMVKK